MTRIVRKAVQRTLLLTILLIGCSSPGSEFVGKWVNSGNSYDTLTISKNGNQFQIAGPDNQTINATYKDGILQMPMMGTTMNLTYVKSSDTVQAPGILGTTEYKRVK